MNLTKAAIDFSDGIIIGSEKIDPEIAAYVKTCKKPVLEYQPADNYTEAYNAFYETILSK